MAGPQPATPKSAKSTGEVVSELWQLLKEYGKQETIDPLKTLWRFISFGAGAAVCFGLAASLFVLTVMRVLRVEALVQGNCTVIPYAVGLVILVGLAIVSVLQIKKEKAP